jgi:hypothetical protein
MNRISHVRLRAGLALAVVAGLAACTETATTPRAPERVLSPNFSFVAPGPVVGELTVCKVGSSASFTTSFGTSFSLNDGDCVLADQQPVPPGHDVTVTENVAAGTQLDSIVGIGAHGLSQLVTNSASITMHIGNDQGWVIVYYNEVQPPELEPGRMTGGGKSLDINGVSVSKGLTLHCDILLSNNLEINWGGTNNFHITRPLSLATCILDPAYDQTPPAAPFNTFIGEAAGTLNGVPGATARFTFIDAGEPGSNDLAQIVIWDGGGNLVLNVPLSNITHGDLQAHYDQPHGNKP